MEGRKHHEGSPSSSSFTSELFGSQESSSSGIFGSLFSTSSKVLGREALHSGVSGKKPDGSSESWNNKSEGDTYRSGDSESHGMTNRDGGSLYQEQRTQPCHLSSSIYYGGQDIYSQPQSTQGSRVKKDSGEDDSGSASRGNWWQGSLYY